MNAKAQASKCRACACVIVYTQWIEKSEYSTIIYYTINISCALPSPYHTNKSELYSHYFNRF